MKRFHKLIGIVLSLTMITLIAGCGGSSSSSDATVGSIPPSANEGTGILSLSITDTPPQLPDNVTAVNIKVIGIEYRHEGEWTEVDGFEHKTLNLLELQKGNSLPLGDFEVPAGHYTEIRFKLAAPVKEGDVKNNPDCNITFEDAPTVPLFVPSGGQSGYKGKGEFEVTVDSRVAVTADFDVYKSIVVTGSGKYLLKPVIRLVVNELSGWIDGKVLDFDIDKYTGEDEENELFVYAYNKNYSYDPDIEEVADSNGLYCINAISGGDVNMTDGNFTLPFLGEGNYTLMTAHFNVDGFVGIVDVENDVEVFKVEGTPVELNTSDYTP